MRDIKFRAWDNVKDRMYYCGEESDVNFEITSIGIMATDITENEDHFKKLEHLKYMMFTGLKDRNGIEIYEGDIVINTGKWFLHARRFYSNQVGTGYGQSEKMVVVKGKAGIELRCIEDFIRHKDGNFAPNGYFHKPYVDNYTAWNLQSTLKVIGNIYENRELLKEVEE